MCAIDLILYFEISTIIKICSSTKGCLNENVYTNLVPWINRMHDVGEIEKLNAEMSSIVEKNKLFGDYFS